MIYISSFIQVMLLLYAGLILFFIIRKIISSISEYYKKKLKRKKEELKKEETNIIYDRLKDIPWVTITDEIFIQPAHKTQIIYDTKKLIIEEKKIKKDWHYFENILLMNNITSLYHITDKSNLESIYNHGFLGSWYFLKENGIDNINHGGNDLSRKLDIRYKLHDYVRLSFTKNLPMIYIANKDGRMPNPYVLEFNIEPIYFSDTIYCPINATDNNAESNSNFETFQKIRFDIIKKTGFIEESHLRKYLQAEVLVKTKLLLNYILKEPYKWKG
jgi:hypothetical protein